MPGEVSRHRPRRKPHAALQQPAKSIGAPMGLHATCQAAPAIFRPSLCSAPAHHVVEAGHRRRRVLRLLELLQAARILAPDVLGPPHAGARLLSDVLLQQLGGVGQQGASHPGVFRASHAGRGPSLATHVPVHLRHCWSTPETPLVHPQQTPTRAGPHQVVANDVCLLQEQPHVVGQPLVLAEVARLVACGR